MKTKITLILCVATAFMILFVGCGDNSSGNNGGCNGLTYTEAFQGEIYEDFVEASNAFNEDPTPQSCEVYKGELQDWFNALAGISSNCLFIPQAEYQASLEEFQEDIDEIDCSDFQNES